MNIIDIFAGTLFSIQFDEDGVPEYHRVFNEWRDLDFLVDFFTKYRDHVDTPFWRSAGLDPDTPELTAKRVISEADILEPLLRKLAYNAADGTKPDLDSHFQRLGGKKYDCLWILEPQKSYGPLSPSLIRLYAIKIDSNCYLIVHGGIKLGHSIQDSPVLKDIVFKKIDYVLNFLRASGILSSEDI